MILLEVSNKKNRQEFIDVAKIIYKDNDTWVCPLDNEIEAIFDPEKNVYYKHGEAQQWILKDDNKNLIGRIAAFIDFKTAHIQDQPTGGMGFL